MVDDDVERKEFARRFHLLHLLFGVDRILNVDFLLLDLIFGHSEHLLILIEADAFKIPQVSDLLAEYLPFFDEGAHYLFGFDTGKKQYIQHVEAYLPLVSVLERVSHKVTAAPEYLIPQ